MNFIENDVLKKLAASNFNQAWQYLDKEHLSDEDKIALLQLVHASFTFWEMNTDHTVRNISIGFWQISRAYAVMNEGNLSLLYADKCIEVSANESLDSFYVAYAYEAKARALLLKGMQADACQCLEMAEKLIETTKETHLEGFWKDITGLKSRC